MRSGRTGTDGSDGASPAVVDRHGPSTRMEGSPGPPSAPGTAEAAAGASSSLPPPLAARLPELAGRLAWLRLGQYPTPVELIRLAGRELWVKREDRSSPCAGLPGGNKLRMLEPVLAHVQERGARTLVSSGAQGSNHLLACACHGARLGLEMICAVAPQPDAEGVQARFTRLRSSGARIVQLPRLELTPLAALALSLAGRGRYFLEPGGSGPRGVLGHLAAALELADQVAAGELPCPAELWVAAGSGGTLAGLTLGLTLAGLQSVRVVGVQVVPRPLLTPTLVAWEAAAALHLLKKHLGGRRLPLRAPRPSEVILVRDQLGAGYGAPTPQALAALDRFQDATGLRLEPTYTGKALAGLLGRLCAPERHGPILFWNTFDPVS